MKEFKINENVDSIVITGNRFEVHIDETYYTKFRSIEELIGIVKKYFTSYRYENIELHKLVLKGDYETGLHLRDGVSGTCINRNYIGNAEVHCYKEYLPFVKCVLLDMGYDYTKSKGGKKKTLK